MDVIHSIRHAYPEQAGFTLERRSGHPCYTFLHFFNPVELMIHGELVRTAPHACILYAPHEPQYFHSAVSLVHDWIHFTDVSSEHLQELGIEVNTLLYPKHPEFVTQLTREMENEFYSSYANKERLLCLKLDELFIKLHRATHEWGSQPVNRELTETLRALRQDTFSNLAENRTVAQMAKGVGLSPSRFFAVYKALFGISPIDDLIAARIGAAKNALVTGNEKIETLAFSLGYNNVTHFIRQFKKHVGVSPSVYRKNNG